MKTYKLFKTLALSFLTILFVACSEDEREPFDLNMGLRTCELPQGRQLRLSIISGNGDYTVTVTDPDILQAQPDFTSGAPFGMIRVNTLKKGTTTLTVKDNVTDQSQNLEIKVTDPYLCFCIEESNHPALSKYRMLYLMNTEDQDAYFFEKMQRDYSFPLLAHGKYELVVENEIPYMVLHYPEIDGEFTDATIAPTPHKFNLSDNSGKAYKIVEALLSGDWRELIDNSDSQDLIIINMKEEATGKQIKMFIHYELLPNGILE